MLMQQTLSIQNKLHLNVDKEMTNKNSIKIVNQYNLLSKKKGVGAAKLIYEDILLYKISKTNKNFINYMRYNAVIICILTYMSYSKTNLNYYKYARELMEEFKISPSILYKYIN